MDTVSIDYGNDIAIIGMIGRFPGASNIAQFWQNLRDGIISISHFSDDELAASGISESIIKMPNYVKARGILEDIELIDGPFFGLTPRDAELTDPQHRLFMECAWEALEIAGYDPEKYASAIGVFAGSSSNTYLLFNVLSNKEVAAVMGRLQIAIASAQDFLATRVSYKFNLRGPSLTVQTACSTSLVTVHLACQSLLNGECDMALAGGVSVTVPSKSGHFYEEGSILSPDGYCRPFDASANGTVLGNGVGVVVLKRLREAIADGDHILAVIKGSAINNDGAQKVGYTAPSVDGQVRVIADALGVAGIDPETVSYVETHGTGTALGDVIEVDALKQVFNINKKQNYCALGAVKSSIGHLDAAAGIAGLIKAVLALENKLLPPSGYFKKPNPQIELENSAFYINREPLEWKRGETPRRVGISSFGIGGTNAHLVVEEAPATRESGPSRSHQLLLISAKTDSALEKATLNLIQHLEQHPDANLADVAFTLKAGRKAFEHRHYLVCEEIGDAIKYLKSLDPAHVLAGFQEARERDVAYMFPGQGSQYVNMALGVYQEEPTFREQLDLCSDILEPHLHFDLRDVLYPRASDVESAARGLEQTAITQPALFAIEYAMAKLWMAWGIHPRAMIGHSIGEYVAACLAGVFSLDDALALVAARGRLVQDLPSGAMLAVPLPEQSVLPLLDERLSLAAVNGPALCVVSGPVESIEALQDRLTGHGMAFSRLHTSHAFHSEMMDPIVMPFAERVRAVKRNPPTIPYISNVTGTWITDTEAMDPDYWARHLRKKVRFSEGLEILLKGHNQVLLEVGPGQTLSTMTRQHSQRRPEQIVVNSLRHPREQQPDVAILLSTVGQLWLAGAKLDWSGFYSHENRKRVVLPTYPFERQRFWIEPHRRADEVSPASAMSKHGIEDSFYLPLWKQSPLLPLTGRDDLLDEDSCWLIFLDHCGLGLQIADVLKGQGQRVYIASKGEQYESQQNGSYIVNPIKRQDYASLLKDLQAKGVTPRRILHVWNVTSSEQSASATAASKRSCESDAFYSLLLLAQSLGEQNISDPIRIEIISNNMNAVTGDELLCPIKATSLGPCRVIPQEYANIACRVVDVVIHEAAASQRQRLVDQLLAEISQDSSDSLVAYRGQHRWVQVYEMVSLERDGEHAISLREDGVYLITGGLAYTGLVFAEHLARKIQARLALVSSIELPDREHWDTWLASHDQDAVSRAILKVRELESLGSQVLVLCLDTSNQEQMNAAVARVLEEFGTINGVLHTESVPGGGLIQLKTPEMAASVFKAKVDAVLVLENALEKVPLDLFALFSSTAAITGGIGQVDYCAGNAFIDAFAQYRSSRCTGLTVAIDWDPFKWEEADIPQGQGISPVEAQIKQTFESFGLTEQQSMHAFDVIVSTRLPQAVVSTRSFPAVIEQYKSFTLSSLMEQLGQSRPSGFAHPRPNLTTTYVAPRNQTEQAIAETWQEIFGIDQLGVYDKFFDLGGSSLLAIQLVTRLRNKFGQDISMNAIFERPTIAELAEILGTGQLRPEQLEEVNRVFEEIKDLSPEELQALLSEDLNLVGGEDANV